MRNLITYSIILTFLFGCRQNPLTVNLTSPKTAYSILTIVADQKGFFKEQGLDVKINYVNTGKIAMDDLLAGKADYANVVETNIAFAGFLNPDIEVFSTIEKVYDATIIGRKDKGILQPSDLKGKNIGVLLATTSQVFLDRFLEKNNISKDSVSITNLLPPAMQSGIIEGSGVDAISIWQPYVYNVQKALGEINQVTFTDTEIYTGYMTFTGKKSFSDNNPEVTEKIIKAYIQAEKYVKENKNEAISLIATFLNIPVKTVNTIWSQYDFTITLDSELIANTEKEGIWITQTQESHKGKSIPNYNKFFNSTYLKKISSEKVKISVEAN
jgi:NitT/TauT family transport system substrate-binding protein